MKNEKGCGGQIYRKKREIKSEEGSEGFVRCRINVDVKGCGNWEAASSGDPRFTILSRGCYFFNIFFYCSDDSDCLY